VRATKVKGALACPACGEVVDPEEHGIPETVEATWQCPECEAVTDTTDTVIEQLACSHDPPEVLREACPECEVWVEPQEYVDRRQCPLCEVWIDPMDADFDETEAFQCGECLVIYQDRDEAKECCK
jgi:hypothetical protein